MNSTLILIVIVYVSETQGIKFNRTILSVRFPYYHLLMTLGTCKENILFSEQKVWPSIRLNRILDIYYSSQNTNSKVSCVEIRILINNTDCYAYSKNGVGYSDFSAALYLPTNMGIMFYNLIIFTCYS